jgi:hypothetical protein
MGISAEDFFNGSIAWVVGHSYVQVEDRSTLWTWPQQSDRNDGEFPWIEGRAIGPDQYEKLFGFTQICNPDEWWIAVVTLREMLEEGQHGPHVQVFNIKPEAA